jgi:hypothetical protein
MTFRELTLLVIIFLLIIPIKIKNSKNLELYNEYDLKLRTTLIKIHYFFTWLVVILYSGVCVLFFLKIWIIN